MITPIRWPATNVKSFGKVGHLNSYFCPIVAGLARPVKSESRFDESRIPFATRQIVGMYGVELLGGFVVVSATSR